MTAASFAGVGVAVLAGNMSGARAETSSGPVDAEVEKSAADWANGGARPSGSSLPTESEVDEMLNSGEIVEKIGDDGAVSGYTLNPETSEALRSLKSKLPADSPAGGVSTQSVDPGACALGIGSFIVLTVFPSARVASVAVRLGKLVGKYGVTKVARILTGSYKVSKRTWKDDFAGLVGAMTGISSLAPCVP